MARYLSGDPAADLTVDQQWELVSGLLRQWLASGPPAEPLREQAGLALEHIIGATDSIDALNSMSDEFDVT